MNPDMYLPDFPKPACEGMKRKEITSLLENELIRLRLERKDAYTYWAHEVWLDRYTDHEKRVDFVQFEPKGGPMYTDGPHVEHGMFTFYEVKSCMADLKSGNGLNFEGDANYLVIPVEMFERYKDEAIDNPDGYVATHTRYAELLLYGIGKNGKPKFYEPYPMKNDWLCRKRSASELLLCMMRAMLANSGMADVSHVVRKKAVKR
jgi:hypothetical protein